MLRTLKHLRRKTVSISAAITSGRVHGFVFRLRSAENKYLQLRAARDNQHPEERLHPKALWESSN